MPFFCESCGKPLNPGDMFCVSCGAAVQAARENRPRAPEKRVKPGGKFRLRYALIPVLALCVAVGAFFGGRALLGHLRFRGDLSDARAAVTAGDYAQAVSLYRSALARRPDSAEAKSALDRTLGDALDACLTDAEAYLANGDFDKAYNAMKKLSVEANDAVYGEYKAYLDALKMKPSVDYIDASAFPVVRVAIAYSGGAELAPDAVSAAEDGQAAALVGVESADGGAVISFIARDADGDRENRELTAAVTVGGLTFPLAGSYLTPEPEAAAVTLVSTDFSDYPTVRAYFRVADAASGEQVTELINSSFRIQESISGGAFVSREVKSAEALLNAEGMISGVSIDLVADKSDSIGYSDMTKIKQIMREFVQNLQYELGDQAEVLAFDSIVQQMCTYTSDSALLTNGINNMSTDGMTAFYDAVRLGAGNAALRGGARCVIAFTDGRDNSSRYTYGDVIAFANEKQVPLYIIGVGSVDETTLRTMAQQTNGRYWYIDDLYDLQEIYNEIYSELKELYLVQYESDGAADVYAPRRLSVQLRGGGYKGESDARFTPARTADGRTDSASKYELFLENVSWEEANQRCLEKGGHLVTITAQAEQDEIIRLAEAAGAQYIWLGGYTSYDDYGGVFAHWITGEDFTYSNWSVDEPSRTDRDGTPEWYLMLWNLTELGGWTWNDQRNNPLADFGYFSGKIAYVCEYE
ncbi:MAG: VWA domain-containing protein [Oscillospiraceae bacterium]|jgi:VWFA-related protein|nr:VWA domain-containing protein [Oscillospiraceae bacterium]